MIDWQGKINWLEDEGDAARECAEQLLRMSERPTR